jgi:hypothetical protein
MNKRALSAASRLLAQDANRAITEIQRWAWQGQVNHDLVCIRSTPEGIRVFLEKSLVIT